MSGKDYFTEKQLMAPPMKRAAYSDRMAYVLAEMSGLAYFPFEGVDRIVRDAAEGVAELIKDKKTDEIATYLSEFAEKMLTYQGAGLDAFEDVLGQAGFELIGEPFNRLSTQGFLCKRIEPDEPSYLVLAFRGTEKK